jgi:hypothetical protein
MIPLDHPFLEELKKMWREANIADVEKERKLERRRVLREVQERVKELKEVDPPFELARLRNETLDEVLEVFSTLEKEK